MKEALMYYSLNKTNPLQLVWVQHSQKYGRKTEIDDIFKNNPIKVKDKIFWQFKLSHKSSKVN